jgi:hypothetical protein
MIKRTLIACFSIFMLHSLAIADVQVSLETSANYEKRLEDLLYLGANAPSATSEWLEKGVMQCDAYPNVMYITACFKDLKLKLEKLSNQDKIHFIHAFLVLDYLMNLNNMPHSNSSNDVKTFKFKLEKDIGMSWDEFGELVRQWQAEALLSKDPSERYFAKLFKPYFD